MRIRKRYTYSHDHSWRNVPNVSVERAALVQITDVSGKVVAEEQLVITSIGLRLNVVLFFKSIWFADMEIQVSFIH